MKKLPAFKIKERKFALNHKNVWYILAYINSKNNCVAKKIEFHKNSYTSPYQLAW